MEQKKMAIFCLCIWRRSLNLRFWWYTKCFHVLLCQKCLSWFPFGAQAVLQLKNNKTDSGLFCHLWPVAFSYNEDWKNKIDSSHMVIQLTTTMTYDENSWFSCAHKPNTTCIPHCGLPSIWWNIVSLSFLSPIWSCQNLRLSFSRQLYYWKVL